MNGKIYIRRDKRLHPLDPKTVVVTIKRLEIVG
jgi:hypothetical protein